MNHFNYFRPNEFYNNKLKLKKMKQQKLLVMLAMSVGLSASAQNKMHLPLNVTTPSSVVTSSKQATSRDEAIPFNSVNKTVAATQQKGGFAAGVFATSEAVVGQTDYDLQTNATTFNRLSKNSDGTMSSMFTLIADGAANSTRGTGYNYFDGASWGAWPTARIETDRTGFVNLVMTSTGQEASIAHAAAGLAYTSRPAKGTGAWTTDLTTLTGGTPNTDTWSRTAVGGANGETIHVIVNDNLLTPNGGHILYSRSTDNGATWGVLRSVIPGLDATTYPEGFGGDSYFIAAKGNTVAFVVGDITSDVALFKSTDNGDTWTKTMVTNNFVGGYYAADGNISDIDGDGTADTVLTNSSDLNVVLDNNGMAHVFYGLMRILDTDPAVGSASVNVFLGTNGIAYWSENATTPVIAAQAEDWNGNGQLDTPVEPDPAWTNTNELSWGRYGNMGLACVPAATIDANGRIYLSYQAINENSDSISFFKTHYQVYVTSSDDGFQTSTIPYNVVTNTGNVDSALYEAAYPCIALTVDNNIYLQYMRDQIPGTSYAAAGSVDAINNDITTNVNEIVVATIPVNEVASIGEVKAITNSSVKLNPNPASGSSKLTYQLNASSDVAIKVVNLIGATVVSMVQPAQTAGQHEVSLNLTDLKAGVYFVNVTAKGSVSTSKLIIK